MIESVYENKFLSLKKVVKPEDGIHGYIFSHESRCDGKIVALLPFRRLKENGIQILLRREITPCWGLDYNFSSVTGGWEGGDPRDTALLEMKEETGYEIQQADLISLGTCFGTKSTDSIYYLYTTDLTDKEQGEATTDGSELEKNASVVWSFPDAIFDVKDPSTSVMFLRLQKYLEGNV